jgi:predicted DsbA family dithiol-disulfide isomerase
MESLTIDVWADVLCPWCYLGEQRLSVAIERSRHAGDIDLKIHTFQLDPSATTVQPLLDLLSSKYGMSTAQAREMENRMVGLTRAEGLPYVVDRVAGSTFDMLRLVHLGDAHGLGWEYLRAMQSEMFGGNLEIFDHKTLVRLGENLGIDGAEIRDVLASDRYADDVREDHDTAIQLGARGVPFTVLGMRLGIPGAVSTSQYAAAIDQAWEQIHG